MLDISKKSMRDVYIHHHLGLGDHIICNAIVRNIAKNYDKVYLFYKSIPWHLPNLEYMYRDMGDKISFIGGMDWHDEFVDFYRITHPGINYVRIGFEYLNKSSLVFDKAFYEQAGIPFEKKFTDFYVQRDKETENQLCNELNPTGEPYVFIHQDPERNLFMNLDYIKNKNLKIIEPTKKYLLLHHMKLIEQASEVHVMESSFKCLIDCFIKEKENMFFHRYMRESYGTGRNYWQLIGKDWKKE
jgi:hypothetical protein